MTEPVWDGQGRDPWLPARLDARLEAAEVERDIRAVVWSALSNWLIQTARRVLRGDQPPNLDAIWARVPAWHEAVERILMGAIQPALALAYDKLLGDGYSWTQRPAMVQYLAEVRSRMVRTPDEVYDLVAGQISTGANLGESLPKLSARVDEVLSTTVTERWPNRATVVARTETIGALNASKMDAYRVIVEDDPDTRYEVMWLATDDRRTRKTHNQADGQRVPFGSQFTVGGFSLAFPGDPTGPPQEVIQCVPGDTLINFPAIRSAMRRRYEGEMVRIELTTGNKLTITPNHPILRGDGIWTVAGEIVEGDHLVSAIPGRQLPGQPHPDHRPTQIGEIYRSACLVTVADRVPLSPPDFHRDSPYGQVEVVPVHGELAFHGEPATDDEIRQFGLSLANFACSAGSAGDGPTSVSGGAEVSFTPPPDMGSFGEGASFIDAETGHANSAGFTDGSPGEPESVQSIVDRTSANGIQVSRDLLDAVPPLVSLAEIVKVDRFVYSGHVFNLDTGHGWYSANSIITRNCRCTPLLVEHGESVDLSNRQMKR